MRAHLHLKLRKLSDKHAGFELLKGLSRLRPLQRKKNLLYSGVRGHSKVEFQGLFLQLTLQLFWSELLKFLFKFLTQSVADVR